MYKIKRFSNKDDEYLRDIRDKQDFRKKMSRVVLPVVGGFTGHQLAKNKALGIALGAAGGLGTSLVTGKMGDSMVDMRSNVYKNSSEKNRRLMRMSNKLDNYTSDGVVYAGSRINKKRRDDN